MCFDEALEVLTHPGPWYRRMTVVGGVAGYGPWSLVELLHDTRAKLRHFSRHFQNHLAPLLGSDARPIILSPWPHVFQQRPIPLACHPSLALVGPEIRHPVVVGVPLPSHPAQAVSIKEGGPTFLS